METKKRELMSEQVRQELETNLIPAYRHYQGQQEPQPAHILISPEQEHPITVSYNANIGNGMSGMVWTGRELEMSIQPETTGNSLLEFIEVHADDFWVIIDGYSCEWDGNNMRGKLTDDANAMFVYLEEKAYQELETVHVFNTPNDLWIDDVITADCNPQELADLIMGSVEGVTVFDLEELVEYITERQKELFSEEV